MQLNATQWEQHPIKLKKYVKSYNSHKFYHDGDGNDDKNVEFDEYE